MTVLPRPTSCAGTLASGPPPGLINYEPGILVCGNTVAAVGPQTSHAETPSETPRTDMQRAELEDERFLLRAFRSFARAADTLERSYGMLRAEVERLRGELEETRGKLVREQALAEMSALLAHEIRNPLGSLELFAGLLAESDLDTEARVAVEHMQAGLRMLAATVNNVLHFHSLPEAERAPLDLGLLVAWASEFFRPLARHSQVVLSVQNNLHHVSVPADRHCLEQVLTNLVLNALRAVPPGGWIELGGRRCENGRSVSLTIADTGPGILPEHLARLFESGFSTRSGSPGLGLAVCRKIVEGHGGTISAENRPGGGARFTLSLPLITFPPDGKDAHFEECSKP